MCVSLLFFTSLAAADLGVAFTDFVFCTDRDPIAFVELSASSSADAFLSWKVDYLFIYLFLNACTLL